MNGFVKILTIIAATGMVATLVAPQAQTAKVLTANWSGLTNFEKTAQGRG